MRRCGRRSREQAVEAEAGARGERSERGERFERGALWKGQSLSGPASGSVKCLSAAPKPSSHSDTRSGLPAISAATSIFGVPGPRSLRYSQPRRQALRRAGLSSPIGQRLAQAFPRSSAPEDSTLEDSKFGDPRSGDPAFGDSMLEGSIFEGSMSGEADVWKSSPALAVPSAAHPARQHIGRCHGLGRQPECSCHRYLAIGARLQALRRPAISVHRYEQTGGLFQTGRRLKQSYRWHPSRRPIRPVMLRFRFGPEERAFSRSGGSRI